MGSQGEEQKHKNRGEEMNKGEEQKHMNPGEEMKKGGGNEVEGEWFDIIVVGGGIMGSCGVYELAKRKTGSSGAGSVLLLEQFDLLHNRGSSHGESRTLRLTYPEPYYPPLVQEASLLWEQAQSEIGYRVVYPTTQLDMGPSNNSSLQAAISSCSSNSIPFRVLDPLQVYSEFSARLAIPEGWIGVVTQGAAVIKPTKAVSMFQALALRHGAVLKDNIKVTSITRHVNGSIQVFTATGHKFRCRKCLVTAGPWMQKLVEEVTGRKIPITPLETTICYWRIKEGYEREYSISGGFPTFANYGSPYVYGTPSLEYPGLIKIAVHGGQLCDPDKRTWTRRDDMMDELRKCIKERFRGRVEVDPGLGPVMTQSCMYSVTADEDFVIDYLGGELDQDVVIAGGFSGHGFKMGPVIARIVADMLLNKKEEGASQSKLAPFKLERFQLHPMGNIKDFAHEVGLPPPNLA